MTLAPLQPEILGMQPTAQKVNQEGVFPSVISQILIKSGRLYPSNSTLILSNIVSLGSDAIKGR